jgi:alpha-glucosidase (family GH31 glycosyl hydrolase)
MLSGGGARVLGMNRRGHKLPLYNRAHYGYETKSEQMNFSMPIFYSSAGFMVHFDNVSTGTLDLDSQNKNLVSYAAFSGEKRYQIIANSSWRSLIKDYTQLTGLQSPPPIWALGNFSSRFGYRSSQEVVSTIQKYDKNGIPVDAVILDLYWFGKDIKGTMGNLAFDRDSFPDPAWMINSLKDMNVKPILITEPFVLNTSSRWFEANREGILCKDASGKVFTYDFYFGHTGLIDVFDPNAASWFWNIYRSLHDQGIAGIWGDLGEPEVHPSALMHFGGLKADDVHNAYGHQWAKLIHDGYRLNFPTERLFNLMRAGAPGSQRYGMIPWSGDVNRTWGGLQAQPEIALQMGMQGMAYMHSDLGGFAGAYDDSELYVRWLQYGVFQPIFRPHAQDELASEPVFKDAKTMQLAKEAIQLRYQLLPYNYNLLLENATTGAPLMRTLYFEYPGDSMMFASAYTYLWGKDFLVAPVLQKGLAKQPVLLPPNSVWMDFYSNQILSNPTDKSFVFEVVCKESSIPTFVRAGAVIPMLNKEIQRTSDYALQGVIWHVFLHPSIKQGTAEANLDNGYPLSHPDYKKETVHFEYEMVRNTVSITIKDGHGKVLNGYQNNIRFHNLPKKTRIVLNGKRMKRLK